MTDASLSALYDAVSRDPDLQTRFRAAADRDELAAAVIAAGFDPTHPDIAAALSASDEMSEAELAATAGGMNSDYERDLDDWR